MVWLKVIIPRQISHYQYLSPFPDLAPLPCISSGRKSKSTVVWTFFWSGKRDLVARSTVCLPKSQGGFGVINFSFKAQAFVLQWVKRYFLSDREVQVEVLFYLFPFFLFWHDSPARHSFLVILCKACHNLPNSFSSLAYPGWRTCQR